MKCPVCKTETLSSTLLLDHLPAHRCTRCEGIFLSSVHYYGWLKSQTPEPEIPLDDTDVMLVDDSAGRVCPECGHLLSRFKVWPNVAFFLDSCATCNGVWLDRGEWGVLEEHHLHNRLNLFLTRPWQAKIREVEARGRFEKMYRERFGAADYARLCEIRAWLEGHPNRRDLLAFLTDPDPFKP